MPYGGYGLRKQTKEFYENGRKILKKEFSIEKDLLEILGKNDEKYNIGYLEDGFILIIYLKDLDKDKTFIIKKEFSVSFEKKGYDLFIPSV